MAKRVLIVDDERRVADTAAVIVRGAGHDVAVAYDAESAFERCEAVHPDVVISDVVMPGMSGIKLAIRIRQFYPGCRVLLVSGAVPTLDLLEEARLQGYDFELLAKPVHPTELLSKISAPPERAPSL